MFCKSLENKYLQIPHFFLDTLPNYRVMRYTYIDGFYPSDCSLETTEYLTKANREKSRGP